MLGLGTVEREHSLILKKKNNLKMHPEILRQKPGTVVYIGHVHVAKQAIGREQTLMSGVRPV